MPTLHGISKVPRVLVKSSCRVRQRLTEPGLGHRPRNSRFLIARWRTETGTGPDSWGQPLPLGLETLWVQLHDIPLSLRASQSKRSAVRA